MDVTQRRAARRARTEQAVRDSIDGIMRDTRYDRIRGLRTRRALVVAYSVLLVALTPAYLVWSAIGGTVVMVVGIVVLALLRQATRVVADAPAELLDERQRDVQARTYVSAYRLVVGLGTVVALVAFMAVLLIDDPESFALVVGIDATTGVLLTFIGLGLGAPTCVYAWEQPQA
jgi:Ca2+/Na+ antiporter